MAETCGKPPAGRLHARTACASTKAGWRRCLRRRETRASRARVELGDSLKPTTKGGFVGLWQLRAKDPLRIFIYNAESRVVGEEENQEIGASVALLLL